MEKEPWETFREFFMRAFNSFEGGGVHSFTEILERARYGGGEVNLNEFLEAVSVFSIILDFFTGELKGEN